MISTLRGMWSFQELRQEEGDDATIGNTDCHSEFCSFWMVWNDRDQSKVLSNDTVNDEKGPIARTAIGDVGEYRDVV